MTRAYPSTLFCSICQGLFSRRWAGKTPIFWRQISTRTSPLHKPLCQRIRNVCSRTASLRAASPVPVITPTTGCPQILSTIGELTGKSHGCSNFFLTLGGCYHIGRPLFPVFSVPVHSSITPWSKGINVVARTSCTLWNFHPTPISTHTNKFHGNPAFQQSRFSERNVR